MIVLCISSLIGIKSFKYSLILLIKKHQLRELSRVTGVSLPSVKNHVEKLLQQDLITEVKDGVYTGYKSLFSARYKTLKRNDLLFRLESSGLMDELTKIFTPNCIVLYGSSVEGKDDERGDIDIFVQSSKKDIDLKEYEDMLKRKINLLCEPDMEDIDDTLKNTLANGIVLRGFLKVV